VSPVYIVIALAIGLRLGGAMDLVAIHTTHDAVRWATGLSFMLMGAAHFTPIGRDVRRLVPPRIGRPALVVAVLGAWQLGGGIGLVTPDLRRVAAGALVLLLLLKLPANVRVAREQLSLEGRYATHPSWRVPAQFLWITLVCWSAL
jgi:uncharacterized membrane protein